MMAHPIVAGSARIGATSLEEDANAGFVARFDSTGAERWIVMFSDVLPSSPSAVATLSDGGTVVAGSFYDTVVVEPGGSAGGLGGDGVYLALLDVDGVLEWIQVLSGDGIARRVLVAGDQIALQLDSPQGSGFAVAPGTPGEVALPGEQGVAWFDRSGEWLSYQELPVSGIAATGPGEVLITTRALGSLQVNNWSEDDLGPDQVAALYRLTVDGEIPWTGIVSGSAGHLTPYVTLPLGDDLLLVSVTDVGLPGLCGAQWDPHDGDYLVARLTPR